MHTSKNMVSHGPIFIDIENMKALSLLLRRTHYDIFSVSF